MAGYDTEVSMPYIDQVQLGTTTYDIHDSRITGGVFNFAGIAPTSPQSAIPVDGGAVTGEYKEGDVVIQTPSGKEFVVVNTGTTATPVLKWAEFGDASDMGGTGLEYVTATGSYQPAGSVGNTNTTVTSTVSYQPSGTINVTLPTASINKVTAVSIASKNVVSSVDKINTKAQTVVTGASTASIGKITSVSTASKNVVSSVSTASIGKVNSVASTPLSTTATSGALITVTGEHTLVISTASVITGVTTAAQTVVTAVTTAAQTMVTAVATSAQTVVTGVDTATIYVPDATATGTLVTDVATAAQTMVTDVTTAAQTVVTGQPTTKTFTGTTATITSTGTYQKATSFTGTTATITVTSAKRFAAEVSA